MTCAIMRGRTLDPVKVARARAAHKEMFKVLDARVHRFGLLALSRNEVRRWRRISGLLYPGQEKRK